MKFRFSDILFSEKNAPTVLDRQDFVVRNRKPVWQLLIYIFLIVMFFTILLSRIVEDTLLFSQILFIILMALGTYVVFIIQQGRDFLLAAEFQNALFTSALSHSNKFCLLIKDDTSIAYIDHSLQEMFPDFYKESRRDIGRLLEMGKVSLEERKTVYTTLEKRVRNRVVFDIIDHKNKPHRLIMSIEPISRPKGFMLMRGHEFVEKRVFGPDIDMDKSLPIFNKNNMNLFSYITDSIDVGAYIIDLFGNIIYANLTLEQWLHFETDELSTTGLSLKNIISPSGLDCHVNDLKNYNGQITMQRKVGGSIEVNIHQRAMFDEQGKIIGYAALVMQDNDQKKLTKTSKESKNNSW